MRENASGFACTLHGTNNVQKVGVVALLLGRHAPCETTKRIGVECETGTPTFIAERRISDDIVEGLEGVAFGEERTSPIIA